MQNTYLTAVFDPRTLLRRPDAVVCSTVCKVASKASEPIDPSRSQRHFKFDASTIWALRAANSGFRKIH